MTTMNTNHKSEMASMMNDAEWDAFFPAEWTDEQREEMGARHFEQLSVMHDELLVFIRENHRTLDTPKRRAAVKEVHRGLMAAMEGLRRLDDLDII